MLPDPTFVRDLALRAGALAQAASRSLRTELKADQSLVTTVDRAVEEYLRQELARQYPQDAVYGEEQGGSPNARGRLWVLDPIDGTTNLVFGLPIWGVSIGLVVDGEPAVGAFHLPRLGETYWFEAGRGAYLNERRLRAPAGGPLLQEDAVGIGSEAVIALDMSRFPSRQRNLGSLAAHWCYAAAGMLRANVSVQDRLHDLGAAYGICREAGCAIEYLEGGEVPFSRFLDEPLNLRPLVVGHPAVLPLIRECLL